MFKNYLNVALRGLMGNKLFSLINIIGLTIGLTAFVLISLFVHYELNYDKQYSDSDNIYRVERNFLNGNEVSLALATNAPTVAPLLSQDFDQIDSATRIFRNSYSVSIDDLSLVEQYFGFADANVFEFFGLELVKGDLSMALRDPASVVLSESTAERYFANTDPIGKSFMISGDFPLTVTGVFKDLPKNTHLKINTLASIKMIEGMHGADILENWGANSYYTYIKIKPDSDIRRLTDKFPSFLEKHLSGNANDWTSMSVRKLTDIHLFSNKEMEISINSSFSVVVTFSAVAFCVLLIACINFMNLSTARSMLRAKEVGVRKTLGADRKQLIIQFLCESMLITTIAMVIAIVITALILPFFSQLVERDLILSEFINLKGVAFIAGCILLVGGLAGSYPAFYLSSFNPLAVFNGQTSGSRGANLVRKTLVVVQFSVSITLIIATSVVYSQMNFEKAKELGYDQYNNLISTISRNEPLWDIYLPMKEALLLDPRIKSVTLSSRVPTDDLLDGSGYISEDVALMRENFKDIRDVKVGYNFFEHYNIGLIAGRYLSEDYSDRGVVFPTELEPHGQGNVVISEEVVKTFGFNSAEDALGKIIIQPLAPKLASSIRWTIVGVVKDIYFASLRVKRAGILYSPISSRDSRMVSIKYHSGVTREIIPLVDSEWQKISPNTALFNEFMDDRFIAMYKDEQRQVIVLTSFSMLAIIIAILGLYGLVSFSTARRSKEIAIRKVMGARSRDIVYLLITDFSKLILIANLIAWPLSYYLMNWWLEKFVYAISLDVMIFIVSSLLVFLVAWVTLIAQTTYVARGRPVNALKYE
jgi:putative ABC transport system permease protein